MMKNSANKIQIKVPFHKFRDMKLRTKLNLYLFMVVLVSCFFIGGISYMSVRRALIDHSEESVVSFMKQIGGRLDEKIQEFQDATYSLVRRKQRKIRWTERDMALGREVLYVEGLI